MITIKEIAEKAGVSIGTVDRVIHERGRVSHKTKEKILSIMKEEGYRRNIVASQLSNSRQTVLAVLMPHPYQNDNFWRTVKTGISEAAEKMSFFKLDLHFFYYDRYDGEDYKARFCEVLETEPAGLLLAPILAEETLSFRDRISEKTKVVFFNSDLPEFSRLSYIGQDSYQSGLTAGKLMTLMTGKTGSVAVIEVHEEDFHINTRAAGFKDYLMKHSSLEISPYPLPSEKNRDEFQTIADNIISEHEDLSGLFVPNSSVHFFAERMPEEVKVIGYDLIEANSRMLMEGKIDFLINQQPKKQGEQAMEYLIESTVLQEKIPEEYKLPIEIICRENLSSYE